MSNKITDWGYEPPTKPGLYLACFGDVEVPNAITYVDARFADDDDYLIDQDGDPIASYNPSYKWARLLVGSEAR